MNEENIIDKANLISVIRNYEKGKKVNTKNRVDYSVSPSDSDKKILIRTITQTKSKSGYIGIDTAREMIDSIKTKKYDIGIIIGEKFTTAAYQDLKSSNIEIVSKSISTKFPIDKLHSIIVNRVEKLCKEKCGKVPQKSSDCKGIINDKYDCKIRLVSDNADFHMEKNWGQFLSRDLTKLIEIEKNMD
jgi:hypothetical protein